MIIVFLSLFSMAADIPGEELFVLEKNINEVQKKEESPQKKVSLSNKKIHKVITGNLPSEYLEIAFRESTQSTLILPKSSLTEIFKSLKAGDKVEARVNHSIIAFPDEKAPVVAEVMSGGLRGIRFIGESSLEPNSKRIFINFNKVVQNRKVYPFKGIGLSEGGQPGLIGKYHSREIEYFSGDFISSFVAGYFDGLIPRRTGPFGQIEADSSIDSAVKKGLSSGALSSAERFREKLKKTPQFSEIGPATSISVIMMP